MSISDEETKQLFDSIIIKEKENIYDFHNIDKIKEFVKKKNFDDRHVNKLHNMFISRHLEMIITQQKLNTELTIINHILKNTLTQTDKNYFESQQTKIKDLLNQLYLSNKKTIDKIDDNIKMYKEWDSSFYPNIEYTVFKKQQYPSRSEKKRMQREQFKKENPSNLSPPAPFQSFPAQISDSSSALVNQS